MYEEEADGGASSEFAGEEFVGALGPLYREGILLIGILYREGLMVWGLGFSEVPSEFVGEFAGREFVGRQLPARLAFISRV